MVKIRKALLIVLCAGSLVGVHAPAQASWAGIAQDAGNIGINIAKTLWAPVPAAFWLLPQVIRPVTSELVTVTDELHKFVTEVSKKCPLAMAAVTTAAVSYAGYKAYQYLQRNPNRMPMAWRRYFTATTQVTETTVAQQTGVGTPPPAHPGISH